MLDLNVKITNTQIIRGDFLRERDRIGKSRRVFSKRKNKKPRRGFSKRERENRKHKRGFSERKRRERREREIE